MTKISRNAAVKMSKIISQRQPHIVAKSSREQAHRQTDAQTDTRTYGPVIFYIYV